MSGDSETVPAPIPDTVQLTIRCAFQTMEDQTVAASSSWTVKQLKEQIKNVHPSHPVYFSHIIFTFINYRMHPL